MLHSLGSWKRHIELPQRSTILIAAALLVTTGLWTAGHFAHLTARGFWPWLALSQLTVLWTVTLMAIAMLAVVRANALEPIFAGLDRAVRLHRRIGLAAILLLVAHVAFLVLYAVQRGASVLEMLVPFWSPEARSVDILVFYALVSLAVLAYDKRMPYERWLLVHRLIGFLLIAGTIHAATEPGTIADFEPLRTWIVILILVGAIAWLYRIFLFNRFGPLFRYRLDQLVPHGADFIDLVMRPVTRRMMYDPGTFVFIRVPALAKHGTELHPFSISSSPVERDLRVSIRKVGEFTRALPSLPPRTLIDVYGPFGGFTPLRYAGYRRIVCIGAGIGITPFLGMLAFELRNHDFRRIWLYYVTRDDHRRGLRCRDSKQLSGCRILCRLLPVADHTRRSDQREGGGGRGRAGRRLCRHAVRATGVHRRSYAAVSRAGRSARADHHRRAAVSLKALGN